MLLVSLMNSIVGGEFERVPQVGKEEKKKKIAQPGFDPGTSGL